MATVTGYTFSDFIEGPPVKKRGRPKKVVKSIFTDDEKAFLLEHARRGKIVTETFRLNISDIYNLDFRSYNVNGKYVQIAFEPELKHKKFEKIQENKHKIKENLIKAIIEADEIDMWGDDGNAELVTYKLTDEDDNMLLKRIESQGKYALEDEKRRFTNKMKQEKRKVLFEKVKKSKRRKVANTMPVPAHWVILQ